MLFRSKRNIYALRLGCGQREFFYNGAHHGMEWITAKLLMRFVFDYAQSYARGERLAGFNVRRLFENTSIYLVPMVNPDGVEKSKKKTGWQANARGVDLNHNYDAGFYEYKKLAKNMGISRPCKTRYCGKYPESEPETAAVASFTRSHNFEYVLALHSQGRVIYWRYGDLMPPKAYSIGQLLAASSGYMLDETEGLASYSGYKDWFMAEFNSPGYTIEVGEGENPLPLTQFDGIYNEILEMLLCPELT